jgi:hypothetical protein
MSQQKATQGSSRREATVEDIHVRNYDAERTHRVWVTVVDDGERVVETTRRLRPGETASIESDLRPDEYDVEVDIDGLQRTLEGCRIGDRPDQTLLVETGNGLVSLSQGVR